MGVLNNALTRWAAGNVIILNATGFIGALLTCFSWMSYRQGFTGAAYDGVMFWTVPFKPMIVIFQLTGYAISKFYGIKFCAELNVNRRWFWMITLHLAAVIFLILFGLIPAPYNAFLIFFNGLALGQTFGLIFSYLEGRTTTHLHAAGMNLALMSASGATRSMGSAMIEGGVAEFWMPALIGAIAYVPMILGTFLFESMPPPTEEDIKQRTKRVPMDGPERWKFFLEFVPGIICFTIYYIIMEILLDFKNNFSVEIFRDLGYGGVPAIFVETDSIVALTVIIPVIAFMIVKNPAYNFFTFHSLFIVANIVLVICTIVLANNGMNGWAFMIICGICLHLSYVPFNGIIFDTLIAMFQYKSNCQFLTHLVDSFGYGCSVIFLFVKNFAAPDLEWLVVFQALCYMFAAGGIFVLAIELVYFFFKYRSFLKVQNEEEKDVLSKEENEENSQEKDEENNSEDEKSKKETVTNDSVKINVSESK